MPRFATTVSLAFVIGAAALAGCAPSIGDKCQTSVDCSQTGDRLCDTTMPDGYCTIFNCEPNTCPENDDAVCVAFDADLDPACGPLDDTKTPRFERSFCMATCDDSSDCRTNYVCVDPTDPKWRGVIVDSDPVGRKVCTVDPGAAARVTAAPPPACYPPDASFDVTPWDGAGGSGGAAGSGGASASSTAGAGGAGGASASSAGGASASSAGGASASSTGGAGGAGGT